jgi:hypothetical protein
LEKTLNAMGISLGNEKTLTAQIIRYLKNTLNHAMGISMQNEKTATRTIKLYLAAYYWPDEDCTYARSKGYGIIQLNGADLTKLTVAFNAKGM